MRETWFENRELTVYRLGKDAAEDKKTIEELARELREEDLEEMKAAQSYYNLETRTRLNYVAESVECSELCLAARRRSDDKLICVGGLVRLNDDNLVETAPVIRLAWLMGSKHFNDNWMSVAKAVKPVLGLMINTLDWREDEERFLTNFVYCKNEKAISFLKWFGARIEDEVNGFARFWIGLE